MKIMNFNSCNFLKVMADISTIPNLVELTLEDCINLVEIHDSVGSLDKLVVLSLRNCPNLSSFPTSLKLRSLQQLCLNGCFRINHFPEIECEMKYLEYINFGFTGIKELPSSIRYLTGLKDLLLHECINLINLPSSISRLPCLRALVLDNCSKLDLEKMGDREQSMLPPTNPSVSNDGCSSILFPALTTLYLTNCVQSELDFFRIFNCSSIPGCVERFVALLEEHPPKRNYFEMQLTENMIPDWFSNRKEVSNSNSCEIDIDVPSDLDGQITTTIAFFAVFEGDRVELSTMFVEVIKCGVRIYCRDSEYGVSTFLWLLFYVPESIERKKYNGHLRVKFRWFNVDSAAMKSCGVHLFRRCEEKMIDSIDGIQVTKRPHDDDGNLESNWYPQQKRHSSSLGVRISTLIQVHERYCARRTLN